jgi:alkylated DNA repair dioxygenase AlkB
MRQFHFFQDDKTPITSITNGEYIYLANFLPLEESNAYFEKLKTNILWSQESMNMFGKRIPFPRLMAWYGDNNSQYSFSGLKLRPNLWTEELLELKLKIEERSQHNYNSVLLNKYKDGSDSMAWHSDDEKELGTNPVIASLNLGGSRKFQLRHTQTKEKIELILTHGSLLIMQGELQHFWQHQVPKTTEKVAERINLTFRLIK